MQPKAAGKASPPASKTSTVPVSAGPAKQGNPSLKGKEKAVVAPDGGHEGEELSRAAFDAAYEIAKILKGLSKKDQLSSMKMAGVQAGLVVQSQFAAAAESKTQQKQKEAAPSKKGKASSGPQKKWGPEVKEQLSKIAALNKGIGAAAKAAGAPLPEGHALLQERDLAFRELKALKGANTSS